MCSRCSPVVNSHKTVFRVLSRVITGNKLETNRFSVVCLLLPVFLNIWAEGNYIVDDSGARSLSLSSLAHFDDEGKKIVQHSSVVFVSERKYCCQRDTQIHPSRWERFDRASRMILNLCLIMLHCWLPRELILMLAVAVCEEVMLMSLFFLSAKLAELKMQRQATYYYAWHANAITNFTVQRARASFLMSN